MAKAKPAAPRERGNRDAPTPADVLGVGPGLAAVPLVDDGGTPEQVRALGEAVRNPDPEVRRLAAAQLGRCRDWRRPAVRELWPALVDPDPAVARAAAEAVLDLADDGDLADGGFGLLLEGLLARHPGGVTLRTEAGAVTLAPAAEPAGAAPSGNDPAVGSVVGLLDALRPAAEVRAHLRQAVGASAGELAGPLNRWLKGQAAAELREKRAVCRLANDLASLGGAAFLYKGMACYLGVTTSTRYPDGVVYLIPFGGSRQLAARTRFADLPDLGLGDDPAALAERPES